MKKILSALPYNQGILQLLAALFCCLILQLEKHRIKKPEDVFTLPSVTYPKCNTKPPLLDFTP